jgi:hypothetical protein
MIEENFNVPDDEIYIELDRLLKELDSIDNTLEKYHLQ